MDQHLRNHNRTPEPSRSSEKGNSNLLNPRKKFHRRGTGDSQQSNKEIKDFLTDDEDLMSDPEHEMDSLDDEEVDEEEGLTAAERQKRHEKRRRNNGLDARIAGTEGVSKDSKQFADKFVLKELLINTGLIAAWYIFSLSISIYNKWMFSPDRLDFHFPLFTTSLHMIVQFMLSSTVLLLIPSLRPSVRPPQSNQESPEKPILTPLFYFTRLVPTGTATALDIGLGNTSLRYITLTFYTMCKSSVLLFVLLCAFLFRLETISWRLTIIIVSMTIGVLMMVTGETAFDALGFALAMSASFFSGFRWALTQILLLRHPATSNPYATLFFLSPIMFINLFVLACFSETPSAVITGLNILKNTHGTAMSLVLLFVPGCLAFCMISAEFTLLQRTNVVTLSVVGIFKEVVTISAAGIVFGDELSPINISGLLVTIITIACYNYLKISKMRREAREKLGSTKTGRSESPAGSERRKRRKSTSRVTSTNEDTQPLMNGDAELHFGSANGRNHEEPTENLEVGRIIDKCHE